MKNVVSFVLGGGRGTRLYPLTKYRAKPAVPLAGKYRLIDIPLSNCLNSGLNRIFVLTQFLSVSLHRHIRQTYRFDRFQRRVCGTAGRSANDGRRHGLVSRHRRRRAEERAVPAATGRGVRLDPFRRPAVPHGLPQDDRNARAGEGRCDDRRVAGLQRRGQRAGHHAGGRVGTGHRIRRETQDGRATEDGAVWIPSGWRNAASRPTAATAWPAWASTCSTAICWSN